MATGVMSSGGGAGVSAKIAVRNLALKRRDTRRIGQQKSSKKFSQFCAGQQRGQGCHSRPDESRQFELFYFDINWLSGRLEAWAWRVRERLTAAMLGRDFAVQNPAQMIRRGQAFLSAANPIGTRLLVQQRDIRCILWRRQ